jgi:hypothetical protein
MYRRVGVEASTAVTATWEKIILLTTQRLFISQIITHCNCCFCLSLCFYLVCEAIDTAATPGLLCQPRVIVKMIVEKQMECRLKKETEVLGENIHQRHFCPSQYPTWPDPGLTPGRRGGKSATNRLSYGAACFCLWYVSLLKLFQGTLNYIPRVDVMLLLLLLLLLFIIILRGVRLSLLVLRPLLYQPPDNRWW